MLRGSSQFPVRGGAGGGGRRPSRQPFCPNDGGPLTYIAVDISPAFCQGSVINDHLLKPYYSASLTAEGINLLGTDQVMNK